MINNQIMYKIIFMCLFVSNVLFAQSEIINFDTEHWILSDNAEITQYAGRTALTGTAYMKDVELLNGTIEVDFITTGERNFGGIMFRIQSLEEYEWCWLRMHKTNGFVQDAIQYAPIFNGTSCWQLNGGRGGISPVDVPKNEWVHMKIEILNDTAKLYVKDMTMPAMVMDNLQLGLKKGSIGLKTYWEESLYFSNFSYKIDDSKTDAPKEKAVSPNILTKWQLSPAYKINDFAEIETYPVNKLTGTENWIIPDVKNSGLVNITKYYGHEEGTPPTCVILRTYIYSDEDKHIKMNFGYSDAACIFLNQKPMFSGNSAYRSRNMAYGGWISYNDAVYLNLKKGRNELLIIIAEYFGGCGFQAKLNDIKGIEISSYSQELNYGVNDKNGRYANTGDANIYYEVYGEGKPVILLHGGFAYIDQFKKYIQVLSKKYKVIAIATRGYGKSEIGNRKYSYNLFAEDIKKIIEKEGGDKAVLIGFSDGAITSYIVASKYPEIVKKVVAMGGASLGISGYTKEGLDWLKNFSSEEFEYYRPDFKKIMPEPKRWDEFIENLRAVWSEPNVLPLDNLGKITCPVLMLMADSDEFSRLERVVEVYKRIPNAQLAIFPDSTHIEVSFRNSKNTEILEQYILKFIE